MKKFKVLARYFCYVMIAAVLALMIWVMNLPSGESSLKRYGRIKGGITSGIVALCD